MNNVVLVGRLASDPQKSEVKDGKIFTWLLLAVNRNFKNAEGVYETDFIKCTLWNNVAACTCEYCHSGDVIGIKGRLQSSKYEDENNVVRYVTEVIAEKVTFLSSSSKKTEEKEA